MQRSLARYSSSLRKWASSFVQADPRKQIHDFFKPGDARGPLGYLTCQDLRPEGAESSYFTVSESARAHSYFVS